MRITNVCNSLPFSVVTGPSVNSFKSRPDKHWHHKNLDMIGKQNYQEPGVPIKWRIRFKLACLVHKILNTGHPPYLIELIQYHKPSRSMRSSASHLLSVLRHNLSFGARTFRVAAPKIWNSIPLHIHQSQTYSSFRSHLKTHYFISAHLAP